jgi:hypothetical protein
MYVSVGWELPDIPAPMMMTEERGGESMRGREGERCACFVR